MLRVSSGCDAAGSRLISIADSGPGIDPTLRERMFEAFFTTKSEGIGLGLSICRSIVEAHGGRLFALPNQPVGSILQFTLPLPPAGTPAEP
jgi:signal transduction histidine kinase